MINDLIAIRSDAANTYRMGEGGRRQKGQGLALALCRNGRVEKERSAGESAASGLAEPPRDTRLVKVVRAHLHLNPIACRQADEPLAHFA